MKLTPQQEIIASIVSYSFCSGTLVLLNKLTLHFLPFPSLVVAFQLLACIVLIYGAQLMGFIQVDPLKWEYVKPYLLYIFFFSTGVYCNMRSLSEANVETVIVFRALSPIIVAFMDTLCLGREWPTFRSWIGLVTLVLGAYGYASFDVKFQSQGISAYFWPTLYTVVIASEMAYGKKIVKGVPLKTMSGPVIYTNLLGFVPMLCLANVGGEYSRFWTFYWSNDGYRLPPISIFLLILGSVVGTGIGYSGWWCREVVSATSFTLIGVVNKCLTILLNLMIWDQHAAPMGILCLFVCIGGGMIYEQSPMRAEFREKAIGGAGSSPSPGGTGTVSGDDDEFTADISGDVHNTTDEETAELIEKLNTTISPNGTKRRS